MDNVQSMYYKADENGQVNLPEQNQPIKPLQSSSINKFKKWLPYVIGGLLLVIVIGGLGSVYFLSQQEQDVRQRAAESCPNDSSKNVVRSDLYICANGDTNSDGQCTSADNGYRSYSRDGKVNEPWEALPSGANNGCWQIDFYDRDMAASQASWGSSPPGDGGYCGHVGDPGSKCTKGGDVSQPPPGGSPPPTDICSSELDGLKTVQSECTTCTAPAASTKPAGWWPSCAKGGMTVSWNHRDGVVEYKLDNWRYDPPAPTGTGNRELVKTVTSNIVESDSTFRCLDDGICSYTFTGLDNTTYLASVEGKAGSGCSTPSVWIMPGTKPAMCVSATPITVKCGETCNTTNLLCPTNHSCIANKCVLTECTADGVTCSPNKCTRTYDCQSRCTQDSQCPTDHICYDDTTDNKTYKICRLKDNPTSTTCAGTGGPTPPATPTEVQCGETCNSTTLLCPNDHTCTNNKCVLNVCLEPGVTCQDNQCTRTFICQSSCENNSQCPSDHSCLNIDGRNQCRLTSNPASDTCTPAASPDPTPNPECRDACSSNTDCPTDHTCSDNICRLSVCLQSGVTCDTDKCVRTYPASTPVPTPLAGCNETCVTNSDCSRSDFICYNSVCRLDSYPYSQSCTAPTTTSTIATTPTKGGQPQLPAELPETGSNEIIQSVMLGIAVLVLGAGILLLI